MTILAQDMNNLSFTSWDVLPLPILKVFYTNILQLKKININFVVFQNEIHCNLLWIFKMFVLYAISHLFCQFDSPDSGFRQGIGDLFWRKNTIRGAASLAVILVWVLASSFVCLFAWPHTHIKCLILKLLNVQPAVWSSLLRQSLCYR